MFGFTFTNGSRARTFFGWTPGLRLVSGRVMPCGCLTGTYDAAGGDSLTILDEPASTCADPAHRRHAILWRRVRPLEWPFEPQTSTEQS